MRLIASWSGGKDSCFALHKAIKQGHTINSLLTMMSDQGKSNFHQISKELLDAQSHAIGIPIVKVPTTPEIYEQQFVRALIAARTKGAEGIITGDIYEVALHEPGWLDRITKEVALEPVRPLWHMDTSEILDEFIDEGFKAIVVRIRKDALGMEWLGRTINREFFNDLLRIGTVDPCGERGEYHTLVTDGPIFRKRIEIQETKTSGTDDWGRLEITRFQLKPKSRWQG